MAFCVNCGKKLKDGDVFCSNCGKSVNKSGDEKFGVDVSKYFKLITNPTESLLYMASSMNDALSFILTVAIPAVYGVISIFLSKYIMNSFLNLSNGLLGNYIKDGENYFINNIISNYSLKIFMYIFIFTFIMILFKFCGIILFVNSSDKKLYRMVIWKATVSVEIFMIINFIVFLLLSFISVNLAFIIYILELSVTILSLYIYLLKNIHLSETKTALCTIMGYVFDILVIFGAWEFILHIIHSR